jgi:hypothetical protein
MALGSTQPLTEMNTRNLPGGKGRPARKADNLKAVCEPIFYKMSEPRRLTTLWASTACYRDSFTFYGTYQFLVCFDHAYLLENDMNTIKTNMKPLTDASKDAGLEVSTEEIKLV